MNSVDIVKGLYESFGAGDIATVFGAMTPDIEWREAQGNPYQPDGRPFVGPDAIVQNLFAKLAEEWESFRVSPASFYDAGETVIVEGRYSGKYKATGLLQDSPFCHI